MIFTVQQGSMGHVLVATRDGRAVCAILFGDDPAQLEVDLRTRFPGVEVSGPTDVGAIADLAALVVRAVDDPATKTEIPLDPAGTDFQRMVWNALREIPPGETASYAEIAARIGRPNAVRAVAAACAANPLAFVVPCHRVVRGDGSLSGYRWGVQRKRQLLEREGALKGNAPLAGAFPEL